MIITFFDNLPVIIICISAAIAACIPALLMEEYRKKKKREAFEIEVFRNRDRLGVIERMYTDT